jgi:hypothetical protein
MNAWGDGMAICRCGASFDNGKGPGLIWGGVLYVWS